jgi:hypothetical protein
MIQADFSLAYLMTLVNSDYMASNDWMTVNNKLERMYEERVVAVKNVRSTA